MNKINFFHLNLKKKNVDYNCLIGNSSNSSSITNILRFHSKFTPQDTHTHTTLKTNNNNNNNCI